MQEAMIVTVQPYFFLVAPSSNPSYSKYTECLWMTSNDSAVFNHYRFLDLMRSEREPHAFLGLEVLRRMLSGSEPVADGGRLAFPSSIETPDPLLPEIEVPLPSDGVGAPPSVGDAGGFEGGMILFMPPIPEEFLSADGPALCE